MQQLSAQQSTDEQRRRRLLLHTSVILVLGFVVFLPSLGNPFLLDDRSILLQNPNLADLSRLREMFTSSWWKAEIGAGLYRPITMLTYALNAAIDGVHPSGYRFINLLLHAVNGVLLYAAIIVAAPRQQAAAFMAALVFALHPVHGDAVLAVVGRAELLAASFLLLAWLCGFRGANPELPRARFFRIAALALFAAALLSKENAIVWPAWLAAWGWLIGHAQDRARLRWWLGQLGPTLAVAALYLVARVAIVGQLGTPEATHYFAGETVATRFLAIPRLAAEYLRLMILPFHLTPDYDINLQPGAVPVLAALAVCSAATLAVLAAARRQRALAFPAIAFALGLAPVSNIFPIGAVLAERFLYLPSLAFCTAAGMGMAWGWQAIGERISQRLALVLGLLLGLCFVALNFDQARVWASGQRLYRHAARSNPLNAKMHYYLGKELASQQRWDKALASFRTAQGLYRPRQRERRLLHADVSQALEARSYLDRAVAEVKRALHAQPTFPAARQTLALLYARHGLTARALRSLQDVETLKDAYSWYDLAVIMAGQGNRDKAISACGGAVTGTLPPARAPGFCAERLASLGYGERAALQLLRRLSRQSRNPFTWHALAGLQGAGEHAAASIQSLKMALAQDNAGENIFIDLGLAYVEQRKFRAAHTVFGRGLDAYPLSLNLANNLASALARLHHYDAALLGYARVLQRLPDFRDARQNWSTLHAFLEQRR